MPDYKVIETDRFVADLEDSALWLYSHNLEQSEELADRKLLELEMEINQLKKNLAKTPFIGPADKSGVLRTFPVYGGRFSVNWFVNEQVRSVVLLSMMDSKYPQNLREYKFEE